MITMLVPNNIDHAVSRQQSHQPGKGGGPFGHWARALLAPWRPSFLCILDLCIGMHIHCECIHVDSVALIEDHN